MRKATAVTWADYSVTCTQMLKTHKHFCICLHTEHSYCSEIMQVFPTINIIILPPTTPFDLFTKCFVTSTWPHPAILSFFKGTVFFPFFLCMLHQQSCLIWKGCCFAIPILAFPVFYWKCSRSKWMSANGQYDGQWDSLHYMKHSGKKARNTPFSLLGTSCI